MIQSLSPAAGMSNPEFQHIRLSASSGRGVTDHQESWIPTKYACLASIADYRECTTAGTGRVTFQRS